MPYIIAEIKHRDAKIHGQSLPNKVMMGADKVAKLDCAAAPLANLALNTAAIRKVMEKSIGLSADRKMPTFSSTTFVQCFKKHRSNVADPQWKVFFFDVYANYNDPGLGMAAVEQLESLGCEVIVPEQDASGYPFIAYGDMDRARNAATGNVAKLSPYAKQGYEIISIEPTAHTV